MKTYNPSDWKQLLNHAVLSGDWLRPANQDAWIKQLRLDFYPLVKGKKTARVEQCASVLVVSGHELVASKLKAPNHRIEREKQDEAQAAMEMFLEHDLGLGSGTIRKDKFLPNRMSFQYPYQTSDFGDPAECQNGHSTEFKWKNIRGDLKVSCTVCGWNKTFRKSWIDQEYRKDIKECDEKNSKLRRFSATEDKYKFYMPVEKLFVLDSDKCPIEFTVHEN